VYVGQFKDDKKHGQGTLAEFDEYIFEGEFRDDEFYQGSLSNDTITFTGEFRGPELFYTGIAINDDGDRITYLKGEKIE